MAEGKKVVVEGSQATGLDVDFGAYPYIAASTTIAGGICVGLGIPPSSVKKVVGVLGSYNINIRAGPFLTKIGDEGIAAAIRYKGDEFGKITGNPRDITYFDRCERKFWESAITFAIWLENNRPDELSNSDDNEQKVKADSSD